MKLNVDSLKESNDFLNKLYENVTSAIFIADHDAKIFNFNNSFKSLFYKPEDEILMHLCGNVIGCIFQIEEKKDCGETTHCCNCPLRNNILKSLTEKVPVYKEKLVRSFFIKNVFIEKHFIFTTKYINYCNQELIIVIVDDITELEEKKKALRLTNKKLNKKNKNLQAYLSNCIQNFSNITKNYDDEKMGLVKEVHHRVGNNLAIILALIKLQNEKMDISNYNENMINTENRILVIKKLHDLIFNSQYKEEIKIKKYINSIVDDLFDIYDVIDYVKLNIDDQKFNIDISLIFGLIINEVFILLSNYYEKNDNSTLLNIVLNNNYLSFTFKNNGHKIDKKNLNLMLITVLTQQIHSVFMIYYNEQIEINIKFPSN